MFMIKVAIVGASGLVGQEIVRCLVEEGLIEKINLTLYSSEKSAGQKICICEKEYVFEKLSEQALSQKFDIVFFSAGDEISKNWAQKFVQSGSFVIDNTNAFRKDKNVPLVVPEINACEIKNSKLIANPNCSTIQMVVVLDRLKVLSKIKKVVVSTYQSVSGAGKEAVFDLQNKTKNCIVEGIYDNVIAKIGGIDENGHSSEENKIMFETNKILNDNIKVIATAVRVPVPYCHSESVYVEFENDIDLSDVENLLNVPHIRFSKSEIFLPSIAQKSNLTFVCRMRKCEKNSLAFFVVADNLRRGAAYNAVKIFDYLLKHKTTK